MPNFDYFCEKCRTWEENTFVGDIPNKIACSCGDVMIRKYKFGTKLGIVGDGEYESAQLKRKFKSKSEYKKYLKKNKLEVLAPGEYHNPVPVSDEKFREGLLIESMKESWERQVIGKQPIAPMEKIDTPSPDDNNIIVGVTNGRN